MSWLYLGCGNESGHYLWESLRRTDGSWRTAPQRYHGPLEDVLKRFDGMLPPQASEPLYQATHSVLPGYGFSALSWWDRSVDQRPKSNSTIFCPSPGISLIGLVESARTVFPWVFARLPQPLTLWLP